MPDLEDPTSSPQSNSPELLETSTSSNTPGTPRAFGLVVLVVILCILLIPLIGVFIKYLAGGCHNDCTSGNTLIILFLFSVPVGIAGGTIVAILRYQKQPRSTTRYEPGDFSD